MGETNSDSESIVTITENELTLLSISSIHTLDRNKKQCGRLEVNNRWVPWIRNVLDVFTETLNSLIENESVIVSIFRNRECISLPKENFQEIETEKEDITIKFHQFKNDFLSFCTKLNHLKIAVLILHQKNPQETRNI